MLVNQMLAAERQRASSGRQLMTRLNRLLTLSAAAAFALAAYPAAVAGQLPIGAEAVNDLGRLAQPMLTVDGEIGWQERLSEQGTTHPELANYATVLQRLGAARRERAQQLLYFCLVNKLTVAKPREFEQEFHQCVQVFGKGRTA